MDEDVLEEGEINDDDCDTYTPLERPANYALSLSNNRFPPQPETDSEVEIQITSESDSDSDAPAYRQKRPKMKPRLGKPSRPTKRQSNSKYNIWATHIQEDVLADTLNTCDVTLKDRSRNVESYDYKLARKQRVNNKRTRSDRNNTDIRLIKQSSEEKDELRGAARNILDLVVTSENTEEEIAKDIANKLYEEKEELICNIVTVVGKEKAICIFKEVKRIEHDGGMLIMNQSRRRTPGGVYFFLIKGDTDITPEQHSKIFEDEKQKYRVETKIKHKKKIQKMKEKIAASRKSLPELLTRAEQCVQKLVADNDRSRRKAEDCDVTNPPPTPETDCHENSGDGIDQPSDSNEVHLNRKIEQYETDFLELDAANDMDLF